jgi:probable rRNA maturation factor
VNVVVSNRQRDLPISSLSVKRLISCLCSSLKIEADEILVYFVTDRKMKEIHHTFFGDPSSTDCMSFPLDPPPAGAGLPTILGEVFVCPKVAIEYAAQHNLDPYEESSRYLIHGILHLIGYGDLEPAAKQIMRRKENWCLKLLAQEGNILAKNTTLRYE